MEEEDPELRLSPLKAAAAVLTSEFQLDRLPRRKLKKSESRSALKVEGEDEGEEERDGVETERGGDDVPLVSVDGEDFASVSKEGPVGDVGVKESSNSKARFDVAFGVAKPLLLAFPFEAAAKSSSKESSKDVAAKLFFPNPQASELLCATP